eukprot:3939654-Rhodomonas_salina.3
MSLGRRRVLTDINSKDSSSRGHAQRGAINTPIQAPPPSQQNGWHIMPGPDRENLCVCVCVCQGGAADVVVMAMLKIARSEAIRELGWRMVMQVLPLGMRALLVADRCA